MAYPGKHAAELCSSIYNFFHGSSPPWASFWWIGTLALKIFQARIIFFFHSTLWRGTPGFRLRVRLIVGADPNLLPKNNLCFAWSPFQCKCGEILFLHEQKYWLGILVLIAERFLHLLHLIFKALAPSLNTKIENSHSKHSLKTNLKILSKHLLGYLFSSVSENCLYPRVGLWKTVLWPPDRNWIRDGDLTQTGPLTVSLPGIWDQDSQCLAILIYDWNEAEMWVCKSWGR